MLFERDAGLVVASPRTDVTILITASRLPLIALLLSGLIGCASAPKVELTSHGRLPVSGSATFVLSATSVDDDVLVRDASEAVGEALTARGWTPDGTRPQWQVETSYAERPESIGAFVEEAASGEPAEWRIAPTPPRWWRGDGRVGVLGIRIVDATSGAQVVRVDAKRRIDIGSSEIIVAQLAEAAVAEALTADDPLSTAPREP